MTAAIDRLAARHGCPRAARPCRPDRADLVRHRARLTPLQALKGSRVVLTSELYMSSDSEATPTPEFDAPTSTKSREDVRGELDRARDAFLPKSFHRSHNDGYTVPFPLRRGEVMGYLQREHIDTLMRLAGEHLPQLDAIATDPVICESRSRRLHQHGLDPTRMWEAVTVPQHRGREHQERLEKLLHIAPHRSKRCTGNGGDAAAPVASAAPTRAEAQLLLQHLCAAQWNLSAAAHS